MKKTVFMKKCIACLLIAAIMICAPFTNVPKNAFAAGEDTVSGTAAEEAPEADAGESTENTDSAETSVGAENEIAENENETGTKLYVKELKLGEGITAEEAQKSLTDEGYFILEKDGKPVDLNEGSTSKSYFYDGPEDAHVYLGYKTTTNPDDAITDMAVMNMKGGYDFQEYEMIIQNNLDTKIKPFLDQFIDTIREYRENYAKPEKSVNHTKADMVRQLLNRYTDDDTDGSPIGDLLLNETKYEMGDEAYKALSGAEKKKHADILIMLLQGNLMGISMIEKYLARAADSSDDTWIDRFEKTSLEGLYEEMEKENPDATKGDIEKKLDKKYNDAAKQILASWSEYSEIAQNYEDKQDELIAESEEIGDRLNEINNEADYEKLDEEQRDEVDREILKLQDEILEQQQDAIAVGVSAQVQEKETDDMNMRDFFSQPEETFKGEGIRKLYPMIASLSKGQIAGLQFLSVADLLDAGLNNVANLKKNTDKIEEIPISSIYEGVNREIFDSGKVALTNDALRQKAMANPDENIIDSFIFTTIFGAAALASGITSLGLFLRSQSLVRELNVLGVGGQKWFKHTGSWYSKNSSSLTAVEGAESMAENVGRLRVGSFILCGAFVALAAFNIYISWIELKYYYHVDFTPIPKYIVDETDITTINDKGEKEFLRNETAYYRVVECNRRSMSKGSYEKYYEKRITQIGDYGDLNGTAGKEWLALYTVKYKNAAPILADSLLVKTGADSSTPPDDYKMGIHMFGEKNAYNLQNNKLLYRDPEAIRIWFKQDTEVRTSLSTDGSTEGGKNNKLDETGTLVGGGNKVLYAGIGFAAGALIVWVIMFVMGRRKKDGTVE